MHCELYTDNLKLYTDNLKLYTDNLKLYTENLKLYTDNLKLYTVLNSERYSMLINGWIVGGRGCFEFGC